MIYSFIKNSLYIQTYEEDRNKLFMESYEQLLNLINTNEIKTAKHNIGPAATLNTQDTHRYTTINTTYGSIDKDPV